MSCPVWQLRTDKIVFDAIPKLMGIVNVTPDSFSDGGQFVDPSQAVDHALQLAAEGAAILDIGGESTRPNADPVSEKEELRRVLPVIEQLIKQTNVPLSIDTTKSLVAREALAAGVQIVNDVTGLEQDEQMLATVVQHEAAVCVMHSQGTPQTMQTSPQYDDIVVEVKNYLAARRDVIQAAGVPLERICLDPGIGFGKTTAHNLALFQSMEQFHELGCPILVGHSRKRFLGEIIEAPQADRLAATIGSAMVLAAKQVPLLRVHDVGPVVNALRTFVACGGVS